MSYPVRAAHTPATLILPLWLDPAPVMKVPGLLSCPYLTDDGVHPHDLISDHAEEPQLVRLGGDLHSTLLTGR